MSITKVSAALMESGTKGADISSASSITIGLDGSYFDITGTTTIATMVVDAGRIFTLQFDGAVTLTHSSALYLSGAENFTSEANDHLTFVAVAANDVRQIGAGLKDGGSPVAAAGGKVLQVVQTVMTTSYSHTGTASVFVDITGFNASITPAATSSKVLVFVSVNFATSNNADHLAVRLLRGSTVLGGHTSLGSRNPSLSGHQTPQANNNTEYNGGTFLDSPSSTSSLTYKIQAYSSTVTFYLNRPVTDTNNAHFMRGISTITLMEIGA